MKVGVCLHQDFMKAFDKLSFVNRSILKMVEWKKFKKEMFEEIQLYREVKDDLLKECSEKDENGEIVFSSGNAQQGGQPKFIADKIPEFNEKINDLFNSDMKISPVKISVSKIPETLEINELEFELLEAFIDLEEVKTVTPEVLPAL